jgi:hypothetical protein
MSLINDINPDGAKWSLLSTVTASSDATIEITDIDGTYTDYVIIMHHVIPVSNAVHLRARISTDGGSTWKSGSVDYSWTETGKEGGTHSSSSDPSLTYIAITNSNTIGNVNGEGIYGDFWLFNPSNSSVNSIFGVETFYWRDGYSNFFDIGAVYEGATTAVDGIQFFMSSGNISSGTFTLYGVN